MSRLTSFDDQWAPRFKASHEVSKSAEPFRRPSFADSPVSFGRLPRLKAEERERLEQIAQTPAGELPNEYARLVYKQAARLLAISREKKAMRGARVEGRLPPKEAARFAELMAEEEAIRDGEGADQLRSAHAASVDTLVAQWRGETFDAGQA